MIRRGSVSVYSGKSGGAGGALRDFTRYPAPAIVASTNTNGVELQQIVDKTEQFSRQHRLG